jgi:NO-binding membrane sensor protein with MHYT domain
MHFVGMFIRLKPASDVTWYIRFSPGFTILSLVVPLLALCLAFFVLGGQTQVDYLRTIAAGIVCGLVIAFMHFSASFRASLVPKYVLGHLVGSIVLSCAAASCALAVFFKFRDQWQDVWYKRLGCAVFLSLAVCGMH